MYKFGYVLEEAWLIIARNKCQSLTRFIAGMLYSAVLLLALRGWLTLSNFQAIETEHALESMNANDMFTNTGANQTLILFLGILKWGLFIICTGLLLFASFYLFSFMQKQFLLEKNQLLIKAYLGSSPLKITGELFFPTIFIVTLSGICGIFGANYFYGRFCAKAVWWLKEMLKPPAHYLIIIDFPFLLLLILLLSTYFYFLKRKITYFN